MQDKNLRSRLTPEQEAELVHLFMIQKKLQSRIAAFFSALLSNHLIPYPMTCFIDSEIQILNPLKRFALEPVMTTMKNNLKYNIEYYFHSKAGMNNNIEHYNTFIKNLLKTSGFGNMRQYIASLEHYNFPLYSLKQDFAEYYLRFYCDNLQNADHFSLLKCIYPTESEKFQVIKHYSSKTLTELYSLTNEAIKSLKHEIEKYNPSNFKSVPNLSLAQVFLTGYVYPVKIALVTFATIIFEMFIARPLLLKLISLLNTKHLTQEQIYFLNEDEASKLIANLMDENKKLTFYASKFDFVNFALPLISLFVFIMVLSESGFNLYCAAIFINLFIVAVKDVLVRRHQQSIDTHLNSVLQYQKNLLNQISYSSRQDFWNIHKGISLDTSYLALNKIKREYFKEICEVIKYALLINGINIVADDRDCIIVSGSEKLDQTRATRVVDNISDTLHRLENIKTLKPQFQKLSKQIGSKYNFYLKRNKNHSIVAIFEQEIPPEHIDLITLESCTKIFENHRIKVKENKLIIVGFKPLGSALREYNLLIAKRKMLKGFQQTPSSSTDSSTPRILVSSPQVDYNVSPARVVPSVQRQIREVVKWSGDYTYDSQNPNCQIYKFFSLGKSKLFIMSKLSGEDFADSRSYDHYLDKVKNPTLASERKGQGFVKVPDLCARDRHGNRFFARWKYRFLGAMGDKRPLCEELKSATGEKLLIVRAVSDHKEIERMQKNTIKNVSKR